MVEYRHGAHSVFEIHLHLVWVTKYGKPVLGGSVGVRVRDLIREICGGSDVLIIKGHVSKDHVHLLVSIPPQLTISRLVQQIEGEDGVQASAGVRARLRKEFWGRHVSAQGDFCCSSGNVTDEVVAAYIENQGMRSWGRLSRGGGPGGGPARRAGRLQPSLARKALTEPQASGRELTAELGSEGFEPASGRET